MKTIFKILIQFFICINVFSAAITFLPSKHGKICAKELESPITFARKHTETRIGYATLTVALYSTYSGVYIALYLQEKPNGRCN